MTVETVHELTETTTLVCSMHNATSMSASSLGNQAKQAVLSDEAVPRIVSEEVSRLRAASDNPDAEIVILDQRAFGNSERELFLAQRFHRLRREYSKTAGQSLFESGTIDPAHSA